MYKIIFVNDFKKELKKIPISDQKRIMKKIEELSNNPFPDGYKTLKGEFFGFNRIRSGSYRIVYEVDKKMVKVLILKIGHRSCIYD